MSLFDSIKYQISEPPTLEEIAAVPDFIFSRWTDQFLFGHFMNWQAVYPRAKVNELVVNILKQWYSRRELKGAVEPGISLLRKLINEYEPL